MCEWNLIFGLTIKTSIQPFHHPGWYLVYMIFIILHKVRVACLTKYKRFNKQKKEKDKVQSVLSLHCFKTDVCSIFCLLL